MNYGNKTKNELIKIAEDLHVDSVGWHQHSKTLEDDLKGAFARISRLSAAVYEANARSHRAFTEFVLNKSAKIDPWPDRGIGFGVGVIITMIGAWLCS